ncbi:MAG TPA: HmuY family protein [Chitinophagaceae bacterium]|nr:HmuY family protein [Chitinophagaceae bacterium]
MKNRIIYAAAATALFFAACSKDKTAVIPLPATVKTKSITVNFSPSSSFTFFSFRDTTIVANSDSATNKWDFGLRLTTFLVNSNASGPGNAGVILQDAVYENVIAAPSAGYAYDTTSSQRAIKDGSWYDYNPATHSFIPKAGKTFIFRTADGHYAKMELLSVAYEPFAGPVPQRLIYNFRYTYQPNNDTKF